MNKVYLAGPFFSDHQKERLALVKAALKKNPTIGKIFEPSENSYTEAEFGSLEWQKATYQLDVNHIYTSDLVVAVIDYKKEEADNEPDSGTAFEIGLAYGIHKPVVVVQFDPKKELNLMISQGLTAYFDVSKGELEDLANYDFDLFMPKLANRPVI
ncbi:nucleoside deoxyribosyltransferase [Ligilactobacillus hayakitensis DSM 18933 = JCM 14209]|uniref:Nucleoside deoxyribosyltransferase n=1 Tax=Ligilactobacillus hayakitensis DSM 18933 = JCM 14209 TaxID=1423755 RepID=A0A0R1WQU6_9LACO|nr:nucleoside 2-deoxyribosyltransferase [Ligilactobacillus hayakitensis]KRM19985.1 nucleoside deoxyribosyltransferase [Ligilactobacillus hayakitensis DSM 18933 = JCM 14209]